MTEIQNLLLDGKTWAEIEKIADCSRSTVAYHARKLRGGKSICEAKSYDWNKIASYAENHTVKECMNKFGFSSAAWSDAVKRGSIKARTTTIPIEHVLVDNSDYARCNLKARIIEGNLIPYVCKECKQDTQWNGKELVLILDHINGKNNDNRLDNLRFLCPNCNSQTETFSGRNKKRKIGISYKGNYLRF